MEIGNITSCFFSYIVVLFDLKYPSLKISNLLQNFIPKRTKVGLLSLDVNVVTFYSFDPNERTLYWVELRNKLRVWPVFPLPPANAAFAVDSGCWRLATIVLTTINRFKPHKFKSWFQLAFAVADGCRRIIFLSFF